MNGSIDSFEKSKPELQSKDFFPKHNADYGTQAYWEERFAQEDAYEWLIKFKDVERQLCCLIPSHASRILVVGCGNSDFSSDLYDSGFRHIVNIDFSETVIENMRCKNAITRPLMEWKVRDALSRMIQFFGNPMSCLKSLRTHRR